MLSVTESKGLKTILENINDNDLFSILETVTKRMYATNVREEAIERILSCTSKPTDLLRRQKVTKKIIFNYLIKVGVAISAELGKSELIKKCLELWNSGDICNEDDFSEMESEQSSCQEVLSMGAAFSKWFFPLLNNLTGFGPEHFWPQCTLQAQLHSGPGQMKEVSLSGSYEVVNFLSSLIMLDKFYFDANDSWDSVLVEEESHGLVKLIIKGIVHQHSNCVGVFDSAFGLVRNPNCENTYKIQLMKLKVQVNASSPGVLAGNPCLPRYQIAQ